MSPAITSRSSTARATQNEVYTVPIYRRPSNLFVRGQTQASVGLPNKGAGLTARSAAASSCLITIAPRSRTARSRAAGWKSRCLKNQTDLLFAQIQGSARIELPDGSTVRINYDAHNGYPYTPVGRILIERNIIPREQMSMQKIREWMEQNPDGANEVRRQNRSYVFFREVNLSDKDEAVGAQGVPLTAGRSIAVDKALHVYGTPFFIEGELPIESEQSKTPFRRLMISQDTGSAIVGPARADLYFGAGAEAGRVSGRLRHNARFAMLVPKSLDPVARGRKLPLPDARPSEKDRKTVSASRSAEGSAEGCQSGAKPPRHRGGQSRRCGGRQDRHSAGCRQASTAQAPVAKPVPLPEARPKTAPAREHAAIVTIATDEAAAAHKSPIFRGAAAQARLSEEERALWESVAKQVKPLRKKPRPAKAQSRGGSRSAGRGKARASPRDRRCRSE